MFCIRYRNKTEKGKQSPWGVGEIGCQRGAELMRSQRRPRLTPQGARTRAGGRPGTFTPATAHRGRAEAAPAAAGHTWEAALLLEDAKEGLNSEEPATGAAAAPGSPRVSGSE